MAEQIISPEYDSFEILIGKKNPQGYPVTIIQSPAGDASGFFLLEMDDIDLVNALSSVENGETSEELLNGLGRFLFDALFTQEIAKIFSSSLSMVRSQGRRLRLHLRLEAPELATLPWEFLYNAAEDSFIPTSSETAVARYIPIGIPARAITIQLPLRILVVISNPSDVPPLDIEQEKGIIQDALANLVEKGLAKLQFVERATIAEINQAMRSFQPHVFHFIGHAYFDEQAYAVLENENKLALPVDERTFREFFAGAPEIRLAVLNACQSATASVTHSLTGLAPRLLEKQLSAVVAMQYPLLDQAALIFAREFYRSLALGLPVDAAISEARKGIFMEMGRSVRDWGTPVLMMRTRDGLLFNPDDVHLSPESSREKSELAGQGLSALANLMQSTEVHSAVVAFQTDFQAASEQLSILTYDKLIHDLFQELENRYYLVEHDRKRLAEDESAWESLELSEPELRSKLDDLLDASKKAPASSDDSWWLQQLPLAKDDLRQGIEDFEENKLERATRRISRVLDLQPTRINARLVATAGSLRLGAIVNAMTTIQDKLAGSELTDNEALTQFANGTQALSQLDKHLTALVGNHSTWQKVDDDLRRVEANIDQDLFELELAWPDVQTRAKALIGQGQEEWAVEMNSNAEKLEEALLDGSAVKIKRFFRRFRSLVGRRFRQVDYDLLTLCQDLQKLGESLDLLLRTLK